MKSAGRKSISVSFKPRELMTEHPRLNGVWTAQIITLFPKAFPGVLGESLTGRALTDGKWCLETIDLRPYGIGKHKNVDDTPAGGGAGLVLRPDVVGPAIEAALASAPPNRPLVYLSPRGQRFDQKMAKTWADGNGVIMLCGRFEGVDQRVLDHYNIQEVSLGDFVLTGGEIAAQAMIDAAVRLRPEVLGNAESTVDESHSNGLLEHPQYTRPAEWNGRTIPEILSSGHHANIEKWRHDQSCALTQKRRPDLWERYNDQENR